MKAKNILMICLFISGLFCLPSKAQKPGEIVSPQTIRKLGAKHFFSTSQLSCSMFLLLSINKLSINQPSVTEQGKASATQMNM